MPIIINPSLTPSRVGIEFFTEKLQAFSGCCMEDFIEGELSPDEHEYTFTCVCGDTKVRIHNLYALPKLRMGRTPRTGEDGYASLWVEAWTGLRDVSVEVGEE